MRLLQTAGARLILTVLALAVVPGIRPLAAAQPEQPVRVTVTNTIRPILDGLLGAMSTDTNLGSKVVVRNADVPRAARDFCRNDPASGPDIVLLTHRLEAAVLAECAKNGITDPLVVEMARAALILAVRKGSEITNLTSRQVWLAIAREVPYRDAMTRNTAVRWTDVDPDLPPQDIRFQLPMREEGSRAMFDALVLEAGCRSDPAVKQVYDAQQRTMRCTTLRTDRVRELPREHAVKALLEAPLGTVGVMTQRQLDNANGELLGLTLDGLSPTPEMVRNAVYDFAASIWLFAKRGRPDVERLVNAAASDAVIGPEGPLPGLGVTPLPEDERILQRRALAETESTSTLAGIMTWLAATGSDAWHMLAAPRVPMPPNMSDPVDFTSLMDLAGYRIDSISSSIGIIPNATMTFGIAREMSDSDQHHLDRILYRDSLARPGAIAAMQRRIIRSILEAREIGGNFEVSKVEIEFLPLPQVVLEVTPKGSSKAGSSGDGE